MSLSSLRVLIAGGGTGGHIIPALAVARELVKRHGAEILFIGTPRGLESRLVPAAGFEIRLIQVGQLKNVSLSTRLRTLADLPRSIFACRRMIREFNPGVVFGVGGYASGPGMAAALWAHVPAMAFEPNAMPGLANRLVGKRVQAAAVNFPAAARWFRNCEITGIPVRPEFFAQGARIFNVHLPQIVVALLDAVPGLTVLHQSGARNFDATLAAFAATGADPGRWRVEPFLDDMAARFAEAHLVVARSGASSVAELAAAGKPSLLVPFAAAADEHQKRNAEAMVAAGAAVMLEEPELEVPGKLLDALVGLLTNPDGLTRMGASARTQAHPDAAERIADRLARLARRDG
jgi:UDP-N-acetylglucosamine--N-acetylmuramyl-(pentapeptide) pyrophosphoryl-undecaprenol N-acetylglucosamine transferase